MKITGTLRNTAFNKEIFHVHFDDGMTINIRRTGKTFLYDNMVSKGLDSYFLKKGKWPKGKNLEKRMEMGVALIERNIKNNRYRTKKEQKENES
jgi:hypothetical protein|tara:strand:- start:202 stop:483 length:282 start_codon:yes stop_codon:yes gene_type:complete